MISRYLKKNKSKGIVREQLDDFEKLKLQSYHSERKSEKPRESVRGTWSLSLGDISTKMKNDLNIKFQIPEHAINEWTMDTQEDECLIKWCRTNL